MLDTIIRFSVLLASGKMIGSEKVFGIYNVDIIIFFNAMPGKKRFANFLIGFYRKPGISIALRNYCFLLPRSANNKGFVLPGI